MKYLQIITVLILTNAELFSQDQFQIKAQTLIDDAIKNGESVGIAAGFSINGTTIWQGAAGFKNKDAQVPFSKTTLTRLASITKPMTAIAILQLVEQGKVDLESSIQTYIPDFPEKPDGVITVDHLLKHTSGIRGYGSGKERQNKTDYPTLQDAAKIFVGSKLLFNPGTDFNYTTYGYTLLGMVIEKASGISYGDYLKQNIWDKAGMSNTTIFSLDLENTSSLYHRNNKGKTKSAKPTNLSDRLPGGGVYSTLTDVLKFGDAILNNKLIKAETLAQMTQDAGLKKEGSGYGMGWYLYGDNANYGPIFGHNGAQIGSSTFMMLLPQIKTTAVVLSNTSGALQTVSDITVKLFHIAGSLQTSNSQGKDSK